MRPNDELATSDSRALAGVLVEQCRVLFNFAMVYVVIDPLDTTAEERDCLRRVSALLDEARALLG